ncbi:glycosyltransferase [Moritella marina ATCC 15381]|uniref:Glycosyltransferase n=1 Tax=Moritella marina ATCC 15381 TaxID=1202962 RepID=A0A5J6WK53_MORMI|nr:glycosyltransferase [Moritella marina]QFI37440.1 glycosyltransferase [Moritella marina ATCC 15381]
MKPIVSVIIPSKNCLSTLPRAIESVWQQDISKNKSKIEIVIIDDGSTDNSWEWICKLCQKHSNIIALKLASEGASTARNHAARLASGTYMAFLDADTFWYEHKLQQQIKFMEANPQVGISFTNCELMNEQREVTHDRFTCSDYFQHQALQHDQDAFVIPEGAAAIFSENIIGTSTVLVRRDLYLALDGFDHNINLVSDWDLWLKFALHTAIGCIKKPLTASVCKQREISNQEQQLKAMEQVIKRYENKIKVIDPYAVHSAHAHLLASYAKYYRQKSCPTQALACDFKALCEQPTPQRFRNILTDLKLSMHITKDHNTVSHT